MVKLPHMAGDWTALSGVRLLTRFFPCLFFIRPLVFSSLSFPLSSVHFSLSLGCSC